MRKNHTLFTFIRWKDFLFSENIIFIGNWQHFQGPKEVTMNIFQFKTIMLAVGILLAVPQLHAQDWPMAQPITLIVPAAAGSTPDISSRKVAVFLGEHLKQSVVVDNKPGAAGTIAMQAVIRGRPDGYTLGFGNIVTMAINRSLIPKMGYDPDKDLLPVIALTTVPNILVVRNELPVKTLKELIALAKKNPGSLTMGSAGNGTTSHLGGELLKIDAQIDFRHIPYRGAQQAQLDVLGGRIDFMFDNVPSMLAAVRGGKVRAIAVTSKARLPALPNVATIDESGLPGFEVLAWGGIVAPAGTPKPIIERLNRELSDYLKLPATVAEAEQNGSVVIGGTPGNFGQLIRSETKKWAAVIRSADVKLD